MEDTHSMEEGAPSFPALSGCAALPRFSEFSKPRALDPMLWRFYGGFVR